MKTDALRGMRVVDISTEASGSYCARLLADFGADVIKIEDTSEGGDPTRRDGVPVTGREGTDGDSALFVYLNQNKRGVALDTSSDRALEIWRRLVCGADVVIDSGEPGELSRRDLAFGELHTINPKAIVVSITPFGKNGPYRDRPACLLTVAALSGWLKVRPGDPTRKPIQVGFPLLDYVSATVAAVGAVAAWRATRNGAEGQLVDVSQQEVAVRMYLYPTIAARLGILTPRQPPFPMYVQTSNGYVAMNVLNPQHRRDAYLYMEMPEEAENPTISIAITERSETVSRIQKKMDVWAADKTREEIFELGQLMRIPVGIPYSLSEVVQVEHFHARGFFRPLETRAGTVQQPVGPLGSDAVREDWKDAPELGEHTTEVLKEWLGTIE